VEAFERENPPDKVPEIGGEAAAGKALESIQPVLDATTRATPMYLPVVFSSHDLHSQRLKGNCKRCHHDMGTNSEVPLSCSECHDKFETEFDLTEVMHMQCRGCHVARHKRNPESAAPVQCLGCHTERK